MSIIFAVALATLVLGVLVALPLAEMTLARRTHTALVEIEEETYGANTMFLLKVLDWEEAHATEQEELRRLAGELRYDAGLESPLSPPQVIPTAPLFAPLPAANENGGLFAANG